MLNNQYWVVVGILVASFGIWTWVKHTDSLRKFRTRKGLGAPSKQAKDSVDNSSESLNMALELAAVYLEFGATKIAQCYIDEVLEAGSEMQKKQASRLFNKLSEDCTNMQEI